MKQKTTPTMVGADLWSPAVVGEFFLLYNQSSGIEWSVFVNPKI